MFVKKITSIYKCVARAINKLEKSNHNYPSLVYPFNVQKLIAGLTVRSGLTNLISKGFLIVNKGDVSFKKALLVLFYFDQGLFSVNEILDEIINLSCQVLSNISHYYNDYEKNLNPYSTKKVTFKEKAITKIYKDIINALDVIQKGLLQKSLINAPAMIQAIEGVNPDINLLSEGIAIVKAQRKFTYYDIVLIMNRFVCGLTRLLYITRDIQDAIDILNQEIECEQELRVKNNSGVTK